MNRNSIFQSAGFMRQAHARGVLVVLGFLLGAGTVFGQSAEELRLTVGKSVVIDYPSDIRQISTSSPEIVDASPVTTREILLHGKGLGNATLVVWSKTGERTFYNVTVDLNLDSLRKILKDSFPNEQIVPESSRDSLTLNGKVSSKEIADRAIALATTFAKTVVNNMELGAPPIEKQVLLRVRFAELDRTKAEEYGVNWFSQAGQTGFYASTQQSPISSTTQGGSGGLNTLTIGSALNLFAFDPKLNLGAFLQALQSENILQILAEPNLVTTNGKEAYFLVGGEFPVPVLQGGGNAGSVTVQFKEFGIRLRFTPVITGNHTIKLHLTQEVSTLDAADGVTFNGFVIPAISTRRAETDVELGEGQSFVVAGLLDNRDTESLSKLPFLGDIPVLGALFKSKSVKKSRTDLVMLVTPEVTQPLGPNDPRPEIAFPKDFLVRLTQADMQNAKNKAGKKN
ncbi:MAG TPA: type II and III secretion system protein family protein [Bryobacteraceae bacterium]|jgi:pilus assembly protein CpaC|nr:type II and III secretion system protein family protein [Bryobacteraceae bacterium]